jgi:DNA-directed RNA polymerase subunit K/omega
MLMWVSVSSHFRLIREQISVCRPRDCVIVGDDNLRSHVQAEINENALGFRPAKCDDRSHSVEFVRRDLVLLRSSKFGLPCIKSARAFEMAVSTFVKPVLMGNAVVIARRRLAAMGTQVLVSVH